MGYPSKPIEATYNNAHLTSRKTIELFTHYAQTSLNNLLESNLGLDSCRYKMANVLFTFDLNGENSLGNALF